MKNYKKYQARRSSGSGSGLLLVYGLLTAVGIYLIMKESLWGWLLLIPFGFIFSITFIQTIALGSYYAINLDSITVFHFFRKRQFNYQELQAVELLNTRQVMQLLRPYQTDQAVPGSKTDLKQSIQISLQMGKILEYCTFQVSYSEPAFGSKINEQGDFVLLTLKSGPEYLLSPQAADDFVQNARIGRY